MSLLDFDIAIVGGGLAGAALACALGDSGLHVALLESNPLSPGVPMLSEGLEGFDLRVCALTEASRAWLEQLGVWPAVLAYRACPYRHMTVWDAEGVGRIDFDAGEINAATLGHIVEHAPLQGALLQRAASRRGVQLFVPATVERFERTGAGVMMQLADGRQLRTALLVGADGANSAVRRWAGIDSRERSYGQQAIVATVACEQPHQHTAWQIFRREGPLALLPLPGGEGGARFCSIVWSVDEAVADELLALDDDAFRDALGRAFEHRLGAITATSPRRAFPLRARHATRYHADAVALVGDAAHTIHPLAGQGINLGFSDTRALAGELLRARRRGLPPGHPSALGRYQRVRRGDNLAMLMAMEGFKRLFGARAPTLALLRNRGLDLVDGSGPLKRLLMRHAMGL
jgi:2-octaprenylphenol hydroxylase